MILKGTFADGTTITEKGFARIIFNRDIKTVSVIEEDGDQTSYDWFNDFDCGEHLVKAEVIDGGIVIDSMDTKCNEDKLQEV